MYIYLSKSVIIKTAVYKNCHIIYLTKMNIFGNKILRSGKVSIKTHEKESHVSRFLRPYNEWPC